MPCIRFLVSGRVQGVFYRSSTQDKARSLDLTGWAKNLPDGRVEVFACGDDMQIKALQVWLWQGPDHASVIEVKTEVVEIDEQPEDFGIRF